MDFLWLVSSESELLKVGMMQPTDPGHSGMGRWWGHFTAVRGRERRAQEAAVALQALRGLPSQGAEGRSCTGRSQWEAHSPDREQTAVLSLFCSFLKQQGAQAHRPAAPVEHLPLATALHLLPSTTGTSSYRQAISSLQSSFLPSLSPCSCYFLFSAYSTSLLYVKINQQLLNSVESTTFLTLFYWILKPSQRTLVITIPISQMGKMKQQPTYT